MLNLKKRLHDINRTIEASQVSTKVKLFFSYNTYDSNYDSYENNKVQNDLNPITIKAYVSDISSDALVYKQYGLKEQGMKSITCDSHYKEWFKKCSKIEIENDTYEVYKDDVGNRFIISESSNKRIRVMLHKF